MTINYTLTPEESCEGMSRRKRRYLARNWENSTAARIDRVLGYAIAWCLKACLPLMFIGSLIAGIDGPHIFRLIALVTGAMLLLVMYALVKVQTPGFAVEQFEKNPSLAGPFSIELTDRGFIHTGPTRNAQVEWRAITTLSLKPTIW